jgi:DNA polymerase-3 subunit beta
MEHLLTIGTFGRRCGLSVSALRFYAECGLVLPLAVDDATGYRYYSEKQLAEAMLVKRLRATEMPVEEIRRFLTADQVGQARLFELHTAGLERHVEALRHSVDELRCWLAAGGGSDADRGCCIQAGSLVAALDQVAFAVSDDEGRPELAGVWVEVRDGSLRLVATDSYRLAVRDLVVRDSDSGSGELRALIGRHQLAELRAVCAQARDATVVLHRGTDGAVIATVEGQKVRLGRDDGRFPDYEQLLSALPVGHRAVTARRPLTEAMAAVGSSTATLAFRTRALDVASDVTCQSLPARWDGPPQQVTINPEFLSEALNGLIGPDVVIEVSDALRPVVLRSADSGTFSVWTMPIRPTGG